MSKKFSNPPPPDIKQPPAPPGPPPVPVPPKVESIAGPYQSSDKGGGVIIICNGQAFNFNDGEAAVAWYREQIESEGVGDKDGNTKHTD